MWTIVGCYVLIFLAVGACVAAAARAARVGLEAGEEPASESQALILEEWEAVRLEHCLPTHCARLVGMPLHAPQDTYCECCASAFLDVRWRRLLGEPLPVGPPSRGTPASSGAMPSLQLNAPPACELDRPGARLVPSNRAAIADDRGFSGRGPYLFALGAVLILGGGILLAAMPGWPALGAGAGLLCAGAAAILLAGGSFH